MSYTIAIPQYNTGRKEYLAPSAESITIYGESLMAASPTGEAFDDPTVYDGFTMDIL